MEFEQQIAFGFTKTSFQFGDRKLDFQLATERSQSGFSVFYENISSKSSIRTVVEGWPHAMFGVLFIAAVIARFGDSEHPGANDVVCYILLFGALLLAPIQQKFLKKDATVFDTHLGKIIILPSDCHDAILAEIRQRRMATVKKMHGQVDPFNDPGHEFAKFRQLKEDGVLTEMEFNEAIAKLQFMARRPQ